MAKKPKKQLTAKEQRALWAKQFLEHKYTYQPAQFTMEETIRRLTPVAVYQQRECMLEYIISHGQTPNLPKILKHFNKRPLTEEECINYKLPFSGVKPKKKSKKTKEVATKKETTQSELIKERNNFIEKKLKTPYVLRDISTTDLFKYMHLLHYTKEDAYMSLLKKSYGENNKEEIVRWSLSTQDIQQLQHFEGESEFYCSVNSLYCPGRHTAKHIKTLNALFVDLDYYNIPELRTLTPIEVFNKIKSEVDFPTESLVISSGAGLYIIWLLETTFATDLSKKYWCKIEQLLIDKFKPYGADTKVKDPARVLRIPGTRNSKNSSIVQIISAKNTFEAPIRYELSDFSNFFIEDFKPKHKKESKIVKKTTKEKKIFQFKNLLTLNFTRTADIEKLIALRTGQKQEGHREYLLFLYRLHLLYGNSDIEHSLTMTLALNNQLYDPLDENEVITKTKYAIECAAIYKRLLSKYTPESGTKLNDYLYHGGCYIYKNSAIINILGITEQEQLHMSTLIGDNEKKRRKNIRNKQYFSIATNVEKYNTKRKDTYKQNLLEKGIMSRDEKNNLLRSQIQVLLNKGLSQREIAKKLNISQPAVSKHIKIIKQQKENLVA